jgi:hypothetical protein
MHAQYHTATHGGFTNAFDKSMGLELYPSLTEEYNSKIATESTSFVGATHVAVSS